MLMLLFIYGASSYIIATNNTRSYIHTFFMSWNLLYKT